MFAAIKIAVRSYKRWDKCLSRPKIPHEKEISSKLDVWIVPNNGEIKHRNGKFTL